MTFQNNQHFQLDKEELVKPGNRFGVYLTTSIMLIFVVLCLLSVIGIWSNILVPNDLFMRLCRWSFAAAVILYLTWLYFAIFSNSFLRKNTDKILNKSGRSKLVMIVALAFVIPMVFTLGCAKGIPRIAHLTLGQPSELVVTVSRTVGEYHGKSCNGQIELMEYPHLFNDSICGIQKEDWERVKQGDKIKLIGDKSMFGFTTQQYQLLQSF